MRRGRPAIIAALGAAALVLSGLASAGRAQATGVGYSLEHVHVDVMIGPNGDQPCGITADVYRPDGVSAADPAPAILTTNGFGGSKDDSNQAAIGKGFAQAGYVVLSYSGLGFGGSGCKITLDDPDWDGRAGSQMVDVLAGTRSFTDETTGQTGRIDYVAQNSPGDPRVGMIGGSYGGEIQYAVAMQDPRVDALIPLITWNDLSYSLAPNNTSLAHGVTYDTPGVAKKEWIDLFFGEGVVDGVQGAQVDPTRDVGCPNFTDQACTSAAQLSTAGYPDDATLALARHASVATYADKVKAPTLLVQGEKDTLFNLQEAVSTFHALRSQGTPVRMVWQSWGHSDGTPAPGELDFNAASLRDSYLGNRFLDWMNHYVAGDDSAPVGPLFSYFRDWVPYDTSPAKAGAAVAKAYATSSTFSEQPTATLYFSGSDALTPSQDQILAGSASYANASEVPTSYSETSGLEGNQVNNPPSDQPGTYAAFTSPPLAKSVALVGSPHVTLHLQSPSAALSQTAGPAGQLILFAKIYDVAPDGTQTLKNRLISPARVADVNRPVDVALPGVVQQFPAGHRIRVVIAASDAAYADNAAPQTVTVTTSPQQPSTLRLPLTGALKF
ncbi:MAG TPA: CocE/NonD family hydrolase [Nocardioides sp.]|uniref:CocE/NonD family hydrolase n=1 Tax=Nocardioides sp. TaxID=35761 RepID=UPI002F42029C